MEPSQTTRASEPWLTALLRPVGDLNRDTSTRLDEALTVLTGCASMVIVDLDAARVGDHAAALVLARAADRLAERDGVLLLVNARGRDRVMLAASGQRRGWSIAEGPAVAAETEAIPASAAGTAAQSPHPEIVAGLRPLDMVGSGAAPGHNGRSATEATTWLGRYEKG